jgi:hypothetical protein
MKRWFIFNEREQKWEGFRQKNLALFAFLNLPDATKISESEDGRIDHASLLAEKKHGVILSDRKKQRV